MRTTKRDFELFKAWFTHYQEYFQLNNIHVYFAHEKLEGKYAEISMDQLGKVATVVFATKWDERDTNEKEIKRCALHECIHLLINRIVWIAGCRYTSPEEIHEEDESLTVKLTHLFNEKMSK